MNDKLSDKTEEIVDIILCLYMECFNFLISFERIIAYLESDNMDDAIESFQRINKDFDSIDEYKTDLKDYLGKFEKLLED